MEDPTVKTISTELGELLLSGVAKDAHFIGEGGVPYTVVPNGFAVKSLEHLMASPARKRALVTVRDTESLLGYLRAHDEQRTAIFANDDALCVLAIVDYHGPAGPGFAEHVVELKLERRPEWKTWLEANKRAMNQATFAQFVEDNLPDIAAPVGAVVLEVVRTLEARKKVNFLSAVRLQDGNREFTYEEQTDASAAKGTLKVPEVFTLGLQPFRGAAKYRLDARLRFRIEDGGKLTLWYDLVRPHLVLEGAFADVVKEIAAATSLEVRIGSVSVLKCDV